MEKTTFPCCIATAQGRGSIPTNQRQNEVAGCCAKKADINARLGGSISGARRIDHFCRNILSSRKAALKHHSEMQVSQKSNSSDCFAWADCIALLPLLRLRGSTR